MSTPPQWIIDELARQEWRTRETYRRLVGKGTALMTEEEYVARALEIADKACPLTWTSDGTEAG